jgi:hypothetical protein
VQCDPITVNEACQDTVSNNILTAACRSHDAVSGRRSVARRMLHPVRTKEVPWLQVACTVIESIDMHKYTFVICAHSRLPVTFPVEMHVHLRNRMSCIFTVTHCIYSRSGTMWLEMDLSRRAFSAIALAIASTSKQQSKLHHRPIKPRN